MSAKDGPSSPDSRTCSDDKNWMNDTGSWWYDQKVDMGTTTSPLLNTDMISPAFWLAGGKEFKITRSDEPSHTPLLQTTGNCLAGQTFRSKITSYGDFRNGKVWASYECLESAYSSIWRTLKVNRRISTG